MKNLYILFIAFFVFTFSNAQIVNIPDPVFKDNLVNQPVVDTDNDGYGDADADTNDDGEIQVSEAEAVIGLYIAVFYINDLEGLQSFINLEIFHCGQQLITDIDVSTMPNLRELLIEENQLTSLDVTHNPNLEILRCWSNHITELDVTQNTKLIELFCSNNLLTSLNVTQNTDLIDLICSGNQITELNVTQNIDLDFLHFGSNNISEIDLTQNFILDRLECGNNLLSILDISQNTILTYLNCRNNIISELDFSNNTLLERVLCNNNQTSTLDLSEAPNLKWLFCNNNQLTNLNIQNGVNIELVNMHAQENPDLTCIQVDDPVFANSQICEPFEGWCKDETTVYSEDCSLGLEDVLQKQISLYPNPAKDVLMVYNESVFEITCIKVYDTLGKLVLEQNTSYSQIDISDLATGILFVKIETDKGLVTKKIIKQ